MSHMTKLDTADIVDPEAFVAAGREMGFSEVSINSTLKMYDGQNVKTDFAVAVPGARYGVGIVKNSVGRYDMVADFWGVRKQLPEDLGYARADDQELQRAFLRATTKHTLMRKFARQGFTARVSVNEDRSLKVVLSR